VHLVRVRVRVRVRVKVRVRVRVLARDSPTLTPGGACTVALGSKAASSASMQPERSGGGVPGDRLLGPGP